jgi:hypothetical protein
VTNELAAAIVREATAATRGERRTASTSSYAEFRSATQSGRPNLGYVERGHELTWWKYMTSPLNLLSGGTDEPAWSPSRFLFEPAEQRVLSRATNAGGGFIVPSDFGAQITSARRGAFRGALHVCTDQVCTGPAYPTGLRGEDDENDVLVCRAHFGRLRRMPERELDQLERVLVRAFAEARYEASHLRARLVSRRRTRVSAALVSSSFLSERPSSGEPASSRRAVTALCGSFLRASKSSPTAAGTMCPSGVPARGALQRDFGSPHRRVAGKHAKTVHPTFVA